MCYFKFNCSLLFFIYVFFRSWANWIWSNVHWLQSLRRNLSSFSSSLPKNNNHDSTFRKTTTLLRNCFGWNLINRQLLNGQHTSIPSSCNIYFYHFYFTLHVYSLHLTGHLATDDRWISIRNMFFLCLKSVEVFLKVLSSLWLLRSFVNHDNLFVLRSNHTVYLCRSLKWGHTTDAWIELWCNGCIVCRGKRTGKRSSYREWFARDRILKNRKSIIRPYKSYIKTAQKQTNEKTNKNKAGSIR